MLNAAEFLRESFKYRLGNLPTEAQHPRTLNLSQLSGSHPDQAIRLIHSIDTEATQVLLDKLEEILELRKQIQITLTQGGRIFLCGCGATGRLSVITEWMWRTLYKGTLFEDKVISFMAGGDLALVRSVENFEDHPEFGEKQLMDLGFSSLDLLISSTEGGETPFVIGASLAASRISRQKTAFLYCNPENILRENVKRSDEILSRPEIFGISFPIGPMVLSGSTRLQASTVLMMAICFSLLDAPECLEGNSSSSTRDSSSVKDWINETLGCIQSFDQQPLVSLIEHESKAYQNGDHINYITDQLGLSVLTDTTERHPTFSVPPFENRNDLNSTLSTCFLIVEGQLNSKAAWNHILARHPRPIDWRGYEGRVGSDRLLGYDFSQDTVSWRAQRAGRSSKVHSLRICKVDGGFDFDWNGEIHRLSIPNLSSTRLKMMSKNSPNAPEILLEQVLLKLALNTHSTIVMGRFGRYQGNVMTYVRPSNGKLIDRTIRYVSYLFNASGLTSPSYEEICYRLFDVMRTGHGTESLVLKCFESLR